MKKLVVFIGESGSGKTTLIARLTERYPEQFKKVVTCTSRPMRVGEVDGSDYHFLSTEYFVDNSQLILVNKTSDGFYYGMNRSDLCFGFDNHHKLLTLRPAGLNKIVRLGFSNIVVVQIAISDELKVKRMQERGDTAEMVSSRLQLDIGNRTIVDLGEIPIIHLCATYTVDENVKLLLDACW